MTVAVVRFPGSNCDRDCLHVVEAVGGSAAYAWHQDTALPAGTTAVIVPGGFSYGDYLRTGAIAAHSPICAAVRAFADAGGLVLGICNGFQILCELRLLPGALADNTGGRFVCRLVELSRESDQGPFLSQLPTTLTLPVAHHAGRYVDAPDRLDALAAQGQIALTYTQKTDDGRAALNGSERAIAGVVGGRAHNVMGLMPHPERRAEARLGGCDGRPFITALVKGGA